MSDLGLGRVKELETQNSELVNLVRQLQLQVQQLQAQPAVVYCGQAHKQGHPSLKEMRAMGVTIAEAYKCGGYESAEAGAAGYSATEMRASGYTVDEVNISLTALKLNGIAPSLAIVEKRCSRALIQPRHRPEAFSRRQLQRPPR